MIHYRTDPRGSELPAPVGLKRSWWWLGLILVSVGLLAWVAFLYLGLRAHRWRWLAWAGLYLALAVVSVAVLDASKAGAWAFLGTVLLLGLWVGSLAHALVIRKEALVRLSFARWLRQERAQLLERELAERLARESAAAPTATLPAPVELEATAEAVSPDAPPPSPSVHVPRSQSVLQVAAFPLYASWGQRVAAWLVDVVLFYVAVFPIAIALLYALSGAAATEGGAIGVFLLAFFLDVLLLLLYLTLCHGRPRGQTLGKRAVGIAVRRADSLERVGYPRALLRTVAALLPWALALAVQLPVVGGWTWLLVPLDNLWPLWDSDARKQTLHDKLAGTVVIRTSASR